MQIARKERKRALLAAIHESDTFQPLSHCKQDKKHAKVAAAEARAREIHVDLQNDERAPSPSPPSDHHAVSKTARETLGLLDWLDDHEDDPAVKVQSYFRLASEISDFLYLGFHATPFRAPCAPPPWSRGRVGGWVFRGTT